MMFAILTQGFSGYAILEVAFIAGAFFGGSALWSAWRLWQTR